MSRARFLLPLLAAATLAGCAQESRGKKTATGDAPRPVEVVRSAKRSLPRVVSAVGTLAAEDRADVSFKVPGRVGRLAVDIGARVAEGDVLATLESRDYALRLERARASLQQARARLGLSPDGDDDAVEPANVPVVRQNRARLEEAKAQLERQRSLLDDGLVSRATFDVAEAAHEVAESQYHDALEEVNNRRGILAERRSDVALAAQQLADTELRAPFSGAVQTRRVNLGEYVAAGTPALTLVKTNPVRLRVEVPEREARAVARGQGVTVRVEGDPTLWRGTVARVSPALEEASRSLVVEAEIPNPKGLLKPGSFARAEIEAASGEPVLVVPATAVIVFAGIEKVVAVKDGKAIERQVVTGRRAGGDVEIVSGLVEGDDVVVRPGNLGTGTAVSPVSAPGAGGRTGD